MIPVIPDKRLRLSLGAESLLPSQYCWRIDAGYVRMVSLTESGEHLALGVWGPGDLIIPTALGVAYQELISLSALRIEQHDPNAEEEQAFVLDQLRQIAALMVLSRIRPAEDRLLQLLKWLGERFGKVNSLGVSLSLSDMNLTHRNLAELSGSTRVTITKALTRFRQDGLLISTAHNDLLIPHTATRACTHK